MATAPVQWDETTAVPVQGQQAAPEWDESTAVPLAKTAPVAQDAPNGHEPAPGLPAFTAEQQAQDASTAQAMRPMGANPLPKSIPTSVTLAPPELSDKSHFERPVVLRKGGAPTNLLDQERLQAVQGRQSFQLTPGPIPPTPPNARDAAVEAAPPPTWSERARQSIANSAIGRSLESGMPNVARALNLEPTETEAEQQRTGDETALPDVVPQWAKTNLAQKAVNEIDAATEESIRLGGGEAAVQRYRDEMARDRAQQVADHPIQAAIGQAGQEFVGGMSSPENLALIAAAPESKLISAYFATQAAKGSFDNAEQAYQAWRAGNNPEAAKYLTESGLNAVIAGVAGTHFGRGVMREGYRTLPPGPDVELPVEPKALPAPPAPVEAEYVGQPPAPAPSGPAPKDAEFTDARTPGAPAPKPGAVIEGEGIPIPKASAPTGKMATAEAALTGKPIDETGARPAVQASTDPAELRKSAQQQKPHLEGMAQTVASAVPGADVVGPRVKSEDSIENKEDRGKPPETNIDNLGVRVVAPNPDAVPAVQQAIESQLPIASKDKIDNNGLDIPQYGVKTGTRGDANQVSELQVIPSPEVADAMKETDPLYAKQKEALVAGDKAKADEIGAKIQAKFEEAKSNAASGTGGRGQPPEQATGAGKPAPTAEITTPGEIIRPRDVPSSENELPALKVGDKVDYRYPDGKRRTGSVQKIEGEHAIIRDDDARLATHRIALPDVDVIGAKPIRTMKSANPPAKGSEVTLPDGSSGTVQHVNPNYSGGGRVVVQTPSGTKTFKGSELKPAQAAPKARVSDNISQKSKSEEAAQARKQAWEMTQDEATHEARRSLEQARTPVSEDQAGAGTKSPIRYQQEVDRRVAIRDLETRVEDQKNFHRRMVGEAVAAGKPVPAEVLKEYPELKPTQAAQAPGPVGAPLPERVQQIKDVAAKGTPVKIFTARGADPEVKAWLQQQGLGNLPVTNVKGHDFGGLIDNEVNTSTNQDTALKIPQIPAGKALYVDLDGTIAREGATSGGTPNEQRISAEQPANSVADVSKEEKANADEIAGNAPRAVGERPESGAAVRGRHAEGGEAAGAVTPAGEKPGGEENAPKEKVEPTQLVEGEPFSWEIHEKNRVVAFQPIHPDDVPSGAKPNEDGEFILEVMKQPADGKPGQLIVGEVKEGAARAKVVLGNPVRDAKAKAAGVAPSAVKAEEAPAPHKFGNTQADIPPDSEAGKALSRARKAILPEDLAGDGMIDDAHITVRYGIDGDDTAGIRAYLEKQPPFEATLGKTQAFPPSEHSDGAAPIVVPVESADLRRMEKELDKHGDFTERSFPEYKPHVTLAYVKPGEAKRYTGMTEVDGKKFKVESVSISKKDGTVEEVKLKGTAKPQFSAAARAKIETDPAKRQEIQNSVAEGEAILKSGRTVAGRKMSADELGAVQRAVDNSKGRLGDAVAEPPAKPQFSAAARAKVEPKSEAKPERTSFAKKPEAAKDVFKETRDKYAKQNGGDGSKTEKEMGRPNGRDIDNPGGRSGPDRGGLQSTTQRAELAQLAKRESGAAAGAEPRADLAATLYSGFADPELFKQIFPDVAQRIKEWRDEALSPGDLQREMMRETRGQMDRRVAIAMHAMRDASKSWRLRSRQDSMDFWNAVENGRIANLNAKDQALAVVFRNAFDQMREEIQDLKPEVLQNYIENYFPHIWERPSMVSQTIQRLLNGKRPFAGKGSFLKQRTIPTMQDGIDLGFTPKTWNPVEMFLYKYAEMAQWLMGHQTLQTMKDSGTAKLVRIGKKAPDGWTQIDDRIGTVYGKEKAINEDKVAEATYDKTYPGGKKSIPSIATEDLEDATFGVTVIRGHYYAPAEAARIFNNFVSKGVAGRSRVYDTLNWMNQNLNALQLGISAFHASTTTINAATSDVALGLQQLAEGKPLKAGASLLKGLTVAPSMVSTMVNGSRLLRQYLDPESYAKMSKEAAALATAGGRVRQNVITLKPLEKVANAWRNGAVVEGLTSIPGAILHAAVAPVMEFYVPRMKLGAFYAMAHDILDEAARDNWQPEQTRRAMQEAWDSVDNRFGQVVYENLFWHKATRDALQLATRSVGWNFGSVRELGGAVGDTARAGAQAASGKMPRLTPRMAFAIALPIVAALVGGVLNYLWTGQPPQTWKDCFYPRTANGERHSIPGYMKDVFSFFHDPIRTALNKMAPLWQATSEAIQNRDFYGTEIRHKDDPWMKQLAEFTSWASKQAIPFSFSGGAQLLKKHGAGPSLSEMLHAAKEHPGDVALGQLGFQPAPSFIQNSPAMNLARDYSMENRPPGTKTQEQAAHFDALNAVVQMYRSDQVDNEQIDKYVDKGVLTDKDVQRAERESDDDPLARVVKNLTISQMLNVWEKADDQEREAIEPIIEKHEKDIDKIEDDEERDKLYKAFDKAMGETEAAPPSKGVI